MLAPERFRISADGPRFSLSPGERAGVRAELPSRAFGGPPPHVSGYNARENIHFTSRTNEDFSETNKMRRQGSAQTPQKRAETRLLSRSGRAEMPVEFVASPIP